MASQEWPPALCAAFASALASHFCIAPVTKDLASDLTKAQVRAEASKQSRGDRLPQLIPEFETFSGLRCG